MKNFIYVLVILLATSCKSLGQESKSSSDLDSLIDDLSWSSFEVVVNYATELKLSEGSYKLVEVGKTASQKLIQSLDDKNKAVAAHLILTQIWEPSVFSLRMCSTYDQENIILIEYVVNNLAWNRVPEDKSYSMDEIEIERIKSYWKSRISENTTN